MKEDDFKLWLTRAGYAENTVNTQMTQARRLDQAYGDLDEHFDRDKFTAIAATLKYSAQDKRDQAPNPSKLPIDGDLYSNLASYRATLNFYQRYRDDDQAGRKPRTPKLGDDQFFSEVNRMMGVFKERMPDFAGFAEEIGQFWETEGSYKRDARDSVIAAATNFDQTEEECGRAVYKALVQGTQQGLPLSWRTQAEISKAPADLQTRFYETVARLARLEAGDNQGLLESARELESLKQAGLPGMRRGEVLSIAISVYGTVNVNDACWFKVRTFDRLGKALMGHKFFASPQFELAEFEKFQWAMNRIRDQLDDWNWRTGSLTDVQGFIWVAMAENWEEPEVSDLTREAVEEAMDECEEIGVEAFLAKYRFGKPRDYWTRREPEGFLFPAKAIVGAAYGFMPEGKPQSAKEFYGGYGEQAANGILQRLGFEIVSTKGGEMAPATEGKPAIGAKPTNLILYGPPGTGKTYATASEAVRLCDGTVPADRDELMLRYQELSRKGRIGFVTFHQSFSYEDFVEGLRPQQAETGDEGSPDTTGFSLVARDGVFKEMARVAGENKGRALSHDLPPFDGSRKIFKMSLGRSWASEDDAIYQGALEGGYVVLGWGGEVDWSDQRFDDWEAIKERWRQDHPDAHGNDPNMSQIYTFRSNMEVGSLIVISDGNMKFRAVAEVTSDYRFVPGPDGEYNHRRSVRWLWHTEDSLPRERIYKKQLSQVSAYQMQGRQVIWDALEQIVASGGDAVATSGEPEPYVLIIDEINRANISKVFGELITLLEQDKRAGQPNALSVKLPYSGEEFSVPANLHVIGTMNTADRSIALLDTALRRRFEFREVMPEPDVLEDAAAPTGVDLPMVLRTLNERIEYLFDREHQIGHAYFMACKSRADVDACMRVRIIPLLSEYFFDDWNKIALVLGDRDGSRFLERVELKPPVGLDEDGEAPSRWRWNVRSAFPPDAYSGLS